MNKKLSEHDFPAELKTMNEKELDLLTYQIRDFLIEKIAQSGGHLASNLGVVELSIALHRVFDSPKDKLIWDVGHQSYVHKILTGRARDFDTLRAANGLSGFTRREESIHDMHDSGHASTSISIGMGYAASRDLNGEDFDVVCVIGDGAMTGGVAFEAMNHAGCVRSKMIVILNDNEMSIEKSNGGLSKHLARLRTKKSYLDVKNQVKNVLEQIPGVGKGLLAGLEHIKDSVRYAVIQGAIFEGLGFKYLGPVDGHNIPDLLEVLSVAKMIEGPVLIHVVTQKGRGYRNAEINPSKFHGIAAFNPQTGETIVSGRTSYSSVFGNKLLQLGETNEDIVAVSAAMVEATGLSRFDAAYPKRLFDVGIAEQHAVTFAAGLALNGLRPFVAIYSTFLQRAYDEILEDVCLENLPVVFMIDRAGIVGNDGETHHGLFDLSYLCHMPNMTVMAPKNGRELEDMMEYALTLNGPCAIRYPRGAVPAENPDFVPVPFVPQCEVLREGQDLTIAAVGKMALIALKAAEELAEKGIHCEVLNVRMVSPIDWRSIAQSLKKTGGRLVTVEDNVLAGGFGESLLALLSQQQENPVKDSLLIAWPDTFIKHGDSNQLMEEYGMDRAGIVSKVGDFFERKA